MQIDLTNLWQIFTLGLATSFGTVLATRIATKLLEFLEAKTKLTLKELQRLIDKINNHEN
jgi:hypothetical protein